MTRFDRWLGAFLVALAFAFGASSAEAGCGCDHPPPAFAPVMPPFGAPGTELSLHVEGGALEIDRTYYAEFRTRGIPLPVYGAGVAVAEDTLRLEAPGLLLAGPTEIRIHETLDVIFTGVSEPIAVFDDSLFTGLPLPRQMPAGDSLVLIEDLYVPVSADGVLYIAVDLEQVQDGTQFAFVMPDTPVSFEPEDVTFFNRESVDLTLFTLGVVDPTARQWGSYYGWDVDEDGGIVGTVYETKVGASREPGSQSDMLTYWRHEFHTYTDAHAPGGSHEVDENGFHADSSLHIDHDRLIIAVRGTMDGKPLEPGCIKTDLLVTMAVSEGPIEPERMAVAAYESELYVESNAALAGLFAGLRGADTINLEPEVPSEEPAPEATDLAITKARYVNDQDRIKVYATSSSSELSPLLSIAGHVDAAPMSWNSDRERYEYKAKSVQNLDGRIAVVSLADGTTFSQVID